jgi:hypothetical protein
MKNAMAGGMILSAALLTLGMPLSGASVGAYAQTPSGTSLTVEALDNAIYQPVETQAFGNAAVQLTDGSYSSIWHDGYDQPVLISQSSDSYAFGDLNGDGADDAAAIAVESITGTTHGIFTVLAVYVNDGGTPKPAVTVSLSPMAAVTQLTITAGAVTVLGKQVGPNDAFCCPSQPLTKRFILDPSTNQLVEAPSAAPTVAQSVSIALKSFPGTVLMLPADQPPFARWPLQGVRLNDGPGYLEYAGDPIQRIGSDVLSIGASVGQVGYDPRMDFKPTCQPVTAYCYFPPLGQSSGAEIFNGLKARGNDAFVLHTTFPSERWSLSWFDKSANTSYTLTLGGANVVTLFEPPGTFNKSNVTAAQKLAALADKLTPWTAP